MNIPTVSVDALPDGALLLDVRENEEWAAGRIAGARHVPMMQLPARLHADPDLIEPDTPVVVVCRVGARSAQVTAWLVQQGIAAMNLEGGMLAWERAGRPMESDGSTPPAVV